MHAALPFGSELTGSHTPPPADVPAASSWRQVCTPAASPVVLREFQLTVLLLLSKQSLGLVLSDALPGDDHDGEAGVGVKGDGECDKAIGVGVAKAGVRQSGPGGQPATPPGLGGAVHLHLG